jgi:hypothetical protein
MLSAAPLISGNNFAKVAMLMKFAPVKIHFVVHVIKEHFQVIRAA